MEIFYLLFFGSSFVYGVVAFPLAAFHLDKPDGAFHFILGFSMLTMGLVGLSLGPGNMHVRTADTGKWCSPSTGSTPAWG